MIKIGIIGTGLIAAYHAKSILNCKDRCIITAICDIEPSKMKSFGENFCPDAVKYNSYQELIDQADVDMVSVCTSNDTHKEIAIYAAEKGIAVLCEKPLGLDAEEVEEMAAACEKSGIINMTGFTYRRIPAVAQIKKLIDEGTLGKIYHYKGRFYADRMAAVDHPLEWRHLESRAGSGVLGDLSSHTLDMALYLLSSQCSKVTDVYGDACIMVPERKDPKTGEMVKVTSDDVCNVIGHFDNGCELILESTRYSPFEMEILVSGEKGAIKYSLSNYNEFQLMLYDSPCGYFKNFRTIPVPAPMNGIHPEPVDRMERQYLYMSECIEKGTQAHPTIGETIYIQKLLDVMKKSYKEEKKIYL